MPHLPHSSLATVLELGWFTLTEADVEPLVGGALRILLVLVGSWIVVRVGKRLVREAVAGVSDPQAGPLDRIRRRDQIGRSDTPETGIALQRRVRRAEALGSVATSIISVTVWTLSIFTILATVNINLGPYIAGLGIIGVALGFGAQDLVKDFISGMFMLLEDQYGIGDIIDSGEASGVVEGITLRTTRIRSVDGTLWFVPNGEIRRLGNMSQDWARTLLDISVAYDTETDHATRVIEQVAGEMAEEEEFAPKFLAVPEVWGVERFGADSVDIRLVIKTTPGDQYALGRELRRRLKQAFDAEGIEIPFPQRMLWIRNETDREHPLAPAADDPDAGDGDPEAGDPAPDDPAAG